ncbi:uncharacterized protein N7515_003507 [Penicillium bovifimosum]|uniref:Uncharacterized protein n=1 Tax=Penicillium bovifimosum TaxID=126998 RepID=A0A9W9L5T0_9EURO|nr:uncharacterized protein N7515_003507 [Penicillium bovifimosum]KAJ5138659.1 hypothetical protein N7515_003507 [Penicillium bovifimosum]
MLEEGAEEVISDDRIMMIRMHSIELGDPVSGRRYTQKETPTPSEEPTDLSSDTGLLLVPLLLFSRLFPFTYKKLGEEKKLKSYVSPESFLQYYG